MSHLKSLEALKGATSLILNSKLNARDKIESLSYINQTSLYPTMKEIITDSFFDCFKREDGNVTFDPSNMDMMLAFHADDSKKLIELLEKLPVLGKKIVNKFNTISSPTKSPNKNNKGKSIFFQNQTSTKDCILMFLNGGKTIGKMNDIFDEIIKGLVDVIDNAARSNRNKESIAFMIDWEPNDHELGRIANKYIGK